MSADHSPERDAEWVRAGYDHWPHFVRVDCDYSADGVWCENGAAFDIDDFPVPADLCAAFRAWQEEFDRRDPERETTPFEAATYKAQGEWLARELKSHLPNCVVIAIDRRVQADLSLCERVPFPGEGYREGLMGEHFRDWKARFLAGEFPA